MDENKIKVLLDEKKIDERVREIAAQINKEYVNLLSTYNRILKHRNAYLKQLYLNGNASIDYLNILTTKLIDLGINIYNIR